SYELTISALSHAPENSLFYSGVAKAFSFLSRFSAPLLPNAQQLRVHKSFSGGASAEATVFHGPCSTETSTLNRCLEQPTGCDQQSKSRQPLILDYEVSLVVYRRLPRSRNASVWPLDNGALIRVSSLAAPGAACGTRFNCRSCSIISGLCVSSPPEIKP